MVGVVAAKDLLAEPSEEEFRLGLRSGIILCNVINKLQSGAVPKVILLLFLYILHIVLK
jgi:kinesin family protein C2/C3